MNTNQEAPILKLPVEVLQLILEFVPAFGRVRYQDENGRIHDHSQVLVIRQVCRVFRIISHGLQVWRDDDFDFSFLLPDEEDEQLRALWEGRLLRALFDDSHFVVQLSQKRSWSFTTLESTFAVLHGIPLFLRNASQLKLNIERGLEIALRRLSVCKFIVDINLELDLMFIDLDVLVGSFPAIQRLSILGLEDFVGSLNNFSALQSLKMILIVPTDCIDISLIPVKSAATLTSLAIDSIHSFDRAEFDVNPLDILHNLDELSIEPLDVNFGTFIANTSTRLSSLSIVIPDDIPSIDLIRDVLSSRCLSRLKSFTFSVPGDLLSVSTQDHNLRLGIPIIDAITSNLSSLQALTFIMGLHLGWCYYFSRLKNLKSLIWTVARGNYHADKEMDGDDLIAEDEDRINTTEMAFERVFADFSEKPVCSFRFM